MVNFPSRRCGARRTPEPVARRLDRLLADPLYSVRSDNEFRNFVTRQFDRVFGTNPMEVDASGRGIDPPPLRTDIEPFRPKVRAGDLRLGAPVGRGAANGFADVLGLQKVLSRLGAFRFDIAEGERSGEARPRLVQAIQRFQKDSGLKVDGLINPAGPTIKTLGQNLFGQGKVSAPPQRDGAEPTRPTLLSGAQAKGPPAAQTPQGAGHPPAQTQGPGTQTAHVPSQGADSQDAGSPRVLTQEEIRKGTTAIHRRLGLPRDNIITDPNEVYEHFEFDPKGPGEGEVSLNDPVAATRAIILRKEVDGVTDRLFPGKPRHNNEVDAFRHAWWSYQVTQEFGPERAKEFGDAHEISEPNPHPERMNDLHNNALGRELPLDPKNKGRPAEDVIMEALNNGLLQTRPLNIPGPPGGVSTPNYDNYGWLGRKPKPRKP